MITLGDMLDFLTRELDGDHIDDARLEARMILETGGGVNEARMIGFPEDVIDPKNENTIRAFAARRKNGEPLAHILGRKEFWSLSFQVTADTLIPRPDSETLIEAALEFIDKNNSSRQSKFNILDLGTGSGCLLLSLLSELPQATGIGVDVSRMACRVATENSKILGLDHRAEIVEGDWENEDLMTKLDGATFDFILCNPPYIPETIIPTLDRDVRQFEPHQALNGGADGLDAYRLLAPKIKYLLKPTGALIFEFGQGQARDISEIIEQQGLKVQFVKPDLANIDRCILATVAIS